MSTKPDVPEILKLLADANLKRAGLPLNHADITALHEFIAGLQETDPEQFRRERPSLDAVPVRDKTAAERRQSATTVHAATLDYGSAGNLIDRAIHHLDEALPTGQKRRAELAFGMLRQGTEELAVWLRAKGYEV